MPIAIAAAAASMSALVVFMVRVLAFVMVGTPMSVTNRPVGVVPVWRTVCLVPVIDSTDVGLPAARDYSEIDHFTFASNEEIFRATVPAIVATLSIAVFGRVEGGLTEPLSAAH
jgi:hypothetical protein